MFELCWEMIGGIAYFRNECFPKVEKVFQVPWLINNWSLSFAHLLIQVIFRLCAYLGVIYDVYLEWKFKSKALRVITQNY